MKEKVEKIKTKLENIKDFLFKPYSCICCNIESETQNDYRLCASCLEKIPFTKESYCLRCGKIIKGLYDYCITCKSENYDFDFARSVFAYTSKTSPMILRFKYGGHKKYCIPFGKMLADFFSTSDLIANAVTFVPMPKSREKQRGYNQAKELCREFCFLTGLEMVDCLTRIKDNIKQSTLNASQRAQNIKGSFAVFDKSKVKDKDILIIDDVATTCLTASDCARALMEAGARNVCVLTLAKTPEENLKDFEY